MLNLSISYVFHHFSTSRQVVEKLIIIKLPPYLGGSKSINTFIQVGYKLNFWTIYPKVKTSGHIDPKLITPRHDVDNLSPSWREVTKYTFLLIFMTIVTVMTVMTVFMAREKNCHSCHCCHNCHFRST